MDNRRFSPTKIEVINLCFGNHVQAAHAILLLRVCGGVQERQSRQ
jgi:hypothetical protein